MMRLSVAVAVLALTAACSSGTDEPKPAGAPALAATPSSPSSSPAPVLRAGMVGAPFEVPGWRITVTSVRCGTPKAVLGDRDDGTHGAGVCVAALTLVNTAAVAHGFDDATSPDFAAFDSAGNRFEGTRWLRGPVNPGVTDTNEYVFDVAAGVKVAAVLVGDVRVSA